ncbi:hypothetical protein [Candidatus Similichlamydia epinepheli]|uniref:hypothetical protein n=1 Tax=Candidatus Similichlamydia epinepheli TaxID=1903953 RepID=UPI000D390E6C|nr:hypothetical protein [Candidatus Similichlamydia epinepheli]
MFRIFLLFFSCIIASILAFSTEGNIGTPTPEVTTSNFSFWIGTAGIVVIALLLLSHYFLDRWTCPIREGERVKIFILNKTNVGQKMCAYLIEVEEELFLVIQSHNQILCQPVRGKAKSNALLFSSEELEKFSSDGKEKANDLAR